MRAEDPLDFQRCLGCGRPQHYVRSVCSHCGSEDLELLKSAGLGAIHATTTVSSRQGAYHVALVDLDEGVRVMTNVVGADLEDVQIGLLVQVTAGEGLQTTATPVADAGGRP